MNDILRDNWPGRRTVRDVSLLMASSGGVGSAPVANAPEGPFPPPAAMPRDLKEGSCSFRRAFTRCKRGTLLVCFEVEALWFPHVHGGGDLVRMSSLALQVCPVPLALRQLGTEESECPRWTGQVLTATSSPVEVAASSKGMRNFWYRAGGSNVTSRLAWPCEAALNEVERSGYMAVSQSAALPQSSRMYLLM